MNVAIVEPIGESFDFKMTALFWVPKLKSVEFTLPGHPHCVIKTSFGLVSVRREMSFESSRSQRLMDHFFDRTLLQAFNLPYSR